MDDLTLTELTREWKDATERAQVFLTRALTCVRVNSRDYNMELHKHHAEKAAKLMAEIIRRRGI